MSGRDRGMQRTLAAEFLGNYAVANLPRPPAPLRLHHPTFRKKKCRATASLKKTFIVDIFCSQPRIRS